MAKENEEGQDVQPQQDAGTMDAGQQQPADNSGQTTDDAGSNEQQADSNDKVDYKSEVEKLANQVKELQSQYTTTSQELSRQQELMRTLDPYIDYGRLQKGQGQSIQPGQQDEEGEEVYLTDKQVKELLNQQASTFRQELTTRDIRAKYPDVCKGENSPEESLVRVFLYQIAQSQPHLPSDQKIEQAVKKAREFIGSKVGEGKDEAEKSRKAAEEEAKKKAAAAAQMSGTASTGKTSPAQKEPQQEMSGENYIEQRRNRRNQTKTVAPV